MAEDLWAALYLAEFDLRYAKADRKVRGAESPYGDEQVAALRERRNVARRAILDMARGGAR